MLTRRALLLVSCFVSLLGRLPAQPARTPVEAEVAALAAADTATVVHFWASWCGNCKREHTDDGWKTFITANPDVKVVFVSIWGSAEDDRKLLEGYGLTELPNFVALRHPNQSRKREDKVATFLDLPVYWTPTTWVFKGGRMRYALNYGEVRFPVLQQLVTDAAKKW